MPVLSLAGCYDKCRYAWLIRPCITRDVRVSSLVVDSEPCYHPLLNVTETTWNDWGHWNSENANRHWFRRNRNEVEQQKAHERGNQSRSFTSVQMFHTHTHAHTHTHTRTHAHTHTHTHTHTNTHIHTRTHTQCARVYPPNATRRPSVLMMVCAVRLGTLTDGHAKNALHRTSWCRASLRMTTHHRHTHTHIHTYIQQKHTHKHIHNHTRTHKLLTPTHLT